MRPLLFAVRALWVMWLLRVCGTTLPIAAVKSMHSVSLELIGFTLSRVEPHRRSESSLVDSVLLSGSCARRDHEAAPIIYSVSLRRSTVLGSCTFAARTAAWCRHLFYDTIPGVAN